MRFFLLILMLIGASAQAQQHVINLPKSLDIRVSDGDTISFRSQGETVRVRLVGMFLSFAIKEQNLDTNWRFYLPLVPNCKRRQNIV